MLILFSLLTLWNVSHWLFTESILFIQLEYSTFLSICIVLVEWQNAVSKWRVSFCVCVCVGTGVAEVKIWNGKPHSVEHEFIIIETHVRISMSRRRRRKKNRRENFLCIKHKKQQINCKLRCFLLNRRRYFTSSISHLLTPDLICSFAFSTSNHIIWGKSFAYFAKIDRNEVTAAQTAAHTDRWVIREETASIAGNNISSCETFFKMLWFEWSAFEGNWKILGKLIQLWLCSQHINGIKLFMLSAWKAVGFIYIIKCFMPKMRKALNTKWKFSAANLRRNHDWFCFQSITNRA